MGGVERRLTRLEQGGAATVTEAQQWTAIVEAAWAEREGSAYTIPPVVVGAMNRPPRPGGWLDAVWSAYERRTGGLAG